MSLKVHRARFIDTQLPAITALAITPESYKDNRWLAVGRETGIIEIYSIEGETGALRKDKHIPGVKGGSVRCLKWFYPENADQNSEQKLPRLFSAGLNGYIMEWDLVNLIPKTSLSSQGGPVWDISINPRKNLIAAACYDSSVKLFEINEDGFEYFKSFGVENAMALSVDWSSDSAYIACGTSKSKTLILDAASGRTVNTIKVRSGHKTSTVVWKVRYLPDGTLVSGDSLGNVNFYDSLMMTELYSFSRHEADVLTLDISPDGSSVFSAGVDTWVGHYASGTDIRGITQGFTLKGFQRYHSHDINAICYDPVSKQLFTGGNDIRVNRVPVDELGHDAHATRTETFDTFKHIHLVPEQRFVACRYPNKFQIWELGEALIHPSTDLHKLTPATALDLVQNFSPVLEIQPSSNLSFLSSAISPCGSWLALSDVASLRLYYTNWQKPSHFKPFASSKRTKYSQTQLDKLVLDQIAHKCYKKEKPQFLIQKVLELSPKQLKEHGILSGFGAKFIKFLPNLDRILIVTTGSQLISFDISSCVNDISKSDSEQVINDFQSLNILAPELSSSVSITNLEINGDGTLAAVTTSSNAVYLFDLITFSQKLTLPTFKTHPEHVAFRPNHSEIVVVERDHTIWVYNTELATPTKWSQKNTTQLPKSYLELEPKASGIEFNPNNADDLLIWGPQYLIKVRLDLAVESNSRNNHELNFLRRLDQALSHEKKLKEEETGVFSGKRRLNLADKEKWNFRGVFSYKHIAQVGYLTDGELVIVERPFFDAFANLPPALERKGYGA